jgi:integrative and conjugative element protein (TIGR02256 family)
MYKLKNNKLLVFTNSVINTLNSYKQLKKDQHESGGILLGKVYRDIIVVDKVTEPSIEDNSGRYFFERNVQKAQKIIEYEWTHSNGERIYLGEWHTHPEDTPTPSGDDKKLLYSMLKDTQMEIDFLIMVIIGIKNPYAAVLYRDHKKIEPLSKLTTKDGLKITLYQNQQGNFNGVMACGYLELATYGNDIYNAAFTSIIFGTINSIFTLNNVSEYSLEEAKAFIRLICLDKHNQSEHRVSLLFESLLIQIQTVLEEMKNKNIDNFVKLKIERLL